MNAGLEHGIEMSERCYNASDYDWREAAEAAVKSVCESKPSFTSDDVWAILDTPGAPACRNKRAIGGVLRRAAKYGWCTQTDNARCSERPECNGNRISIWHSNLYQRQAA